MPWSPEADEIRDLNFSASHERHTRAIEAILAIHFRVGDGLCGNCGGGFPCSTLRAVRDALSGVKS